MRINHSDLLPEYNLVLDSLFKEKIDVSLVDNNGNSALFYAI